MNGSASVGSSSTEGSQRKDIGKMISVRSGDNRHGGLLLAMLGDDVGLVTVDCM